MVKAKEATSNSWMNFSYNGYDLASLSYRKYVLLSIIVIIIIIRSY